MAIYLTVKNSGSTAVSVDKRACEKSWENFDSLENFIVHTTHKKFANFEEKGKNNEEILSEIRKHKCLFFQTLTPIPSWPIL